MNVLVLGGTGAIGSSLVRQIVETGGQVTVTSRAHREPSGGVQYIQGDAQDVLFIESLVRRPWDAIVDFMTYPTSVFATRVDLLTANTSQYVFLSSARVYAESDSPLTEESPRLLDTSKDQTYLSTDEYALAKARQEDLLMKLSRRNWTIVRPYITYSDERLQLGIFEKESWLYRALQRRTIVVSKDVALRQTTLTHGRDVAAGLRSLVGRVDALGEAIHIATNQSTTWSEVLGIYLDTLENISGTRTSVRALDLDAFSRCHQSPYQLRYDRLYNRVFDNSKLSRYINPEDFIPCDQGLRECLAQFLEKRSFKAINWRFEAVRDRSCGERARLSEIEGMRERMRYAYFRFLKS